MACHCLAESNALLVEHNTKLSGTLFFPRDGSAAFVTVTLVTEKIEPRGKKTVLMAPTFCPLCGERYVAEPATPAEVRS